MANTGITNSLLGFFYQKGSPDYPNSCSPDDKFGWTTSDGSEKTDPIFKYTVNQVEKSFTKVKEFSFPSELYVDERINMILLESDGDYNKVIEAAASSYESQFYKKLTYIIDSIRNHAIEIRSPAAGYTNALDKELSESEYVRDMYQTGSINPSSDAWRTVDDEIRLKYIVFGVKTDGGEIYSVRIYFDADAFCERATAIDQYKVWKYTDLDNDNIINPTEMNEQVVAKLFEINKTGKFIKYERKFIDKRLSDGSYIKEQFFVFIPTYANVTEDMLNAAIINYLRNVLGLSESYLKYTYPKLFTDNEITILPIWDNYAVQSDNTTKVVTPVTLKKICQVLNKHGIDISGFATGVDAVPAVEVFYIGPGRNWTPSTVGFKFGFPILAIEDDPNNGIVAPITARFPNWKPIYGENETGLAAELHFILITILTAIDNGFAKSMVENNENDFVTDYVMQYTVSTFGQEVISFNFDGNVYKVYGRIAGVTEAANASEEG